MKTVHTLIIGGGQAGLALSRSLRDRGIEHVILERGRIGERWRRQSWDSLRLLTPRWQARLPGWAYDGPDPDGFMTTPELIDYLERYAASFTAPIEEGVTVRRVRRVGEEFAVETDRASWTAKNVVVATGDCHDAFVPDMANAVSGRIEQVVPTDYKRPSQLAEGGVLVVGASATGVQLAAEIHQSGRPVTLSVSRHTRLPRTYRGRDILWWLDRMGVLDERSTEVADLNRSRSQPSMQLVGTPDRGSLDIGVLHEMGVRLVGRTQSADGSRIGFDDDLDDTTVTADLKLGRLRMRIDAFATAQGYNHIVDAPEPFRRVDVPDGPASIDLEAEGIRTIVWATGFKREYPWLEIPVLDAHGELRHAGGVTPVPGLFAMGLRFLRRRNSSFIDGQEKDATELATIIAERDAHPEAVILGAAGRRPPAFQAVAS